MYLFKVLEYFPEIIWRSGRSSGISSRMRSRKSSAKSAGAPRYRHSAAHCCALLRMNAMNAMKDMLDMSPRSFPKERFMDRKVAPKYI